MITINKQNLILIAVAVAVIAIIWYITSKNTKKILAASKNTDGSTTDNTYTGPWANPNQSKPATQSTQQLADEVAVELEGWFGSTKTEQVFNRILLLSDSDLQSLAAYYKSKYKESLYKDIDELLMPFNPTRDKLQKRLEILNLK